MKKVTFMKVLSLIALAGNVFFMLWMTYNGIKEGFRGTWPEKISYVILMGLLAVNIFLIILKKGNNFKR